MPAEPRSTLPHDQPPNPTAESDEVARAAARRRVAGLGGRGVPRPPADPPPTTPEATAAVGAELTPPAALAGELAAGDKLVQQLGTLTAAPRLREDAQARAVDADALVRLGLLLVNVRGHVGALRPVPPELLLRIGALVQLWQDTRGIHPPEPESAQADAGAA